MVTPALPATELVNIVIIPPKPAVRLGEPISSTVPLPGSPFPPGVAVSPAFIMIAIDELTSALTVISPVVVIMLIGPAAVRGALIAVAPPCIMIGPLILIGLVIVMAAVFVGLPMVKPPKVAELLMVKPARGQTKGAAKETPEGTKFNEPAPMSIVAPLKE